MDKYKTILNEEETEEVIKKSKFISYSISCSSVLEFEKKLKEIKELHSKARHHCYAYRIFENSVIEKYQDDKEPSGTAGPPILDVIRGRDLLQCAVVVVRYFGGVKLGTGGLTRAYSDGAVNVINASEIVENQMGYYYDISMDYNLSGKIEYFFSKEQIPIIDTKYDSKICYTVVLKEENRNEVIEEMKNITSAKFEYKEGIKKYGAFKENLFIALDE